MERFFHVGLNVEVKDKLNVKNSERVDSGETRLPFIGVLEVTFVLRCI